MNLLCETLPSTVMVGGSRFEIDTSVGAAVRFEALMHDDTIPENAKPMLALRMFYPKLPPDLVEAYRQLLWFYSGGERAKEGDGSSGGMQAETYSFAHDHALIYAAFYSQYGIDLQKTELHWWAFLALFSALSEDNLIVKVMGWRTTDTSKLKGEQRSFVQKMQRQYRLPHTQKENAQDKEIAEILLHGGDLAARARAKSTQW